MKAFIRNTALLAGLLFTTAALAQDKAGSGTSIAQAQTESKLNAKHVQVVFSAEELTRRLVLSADQADKLKSIEEDSNKQIRAAEKLEVKEREAKMERITAERIKQVASVLTADQQVKLNKMKDALLKEQRSQRVRPAGNTAK